MYKITLKQGYNDIGFYFNDMSWALGFVEIAIKHGIVEDKEGDKKRVEARVEKMNPEDLNMEDKEC